MVYFKKMTVVYLTLVIFFAHLVVARPGVMEEFGLSHENRCDKNIEKVIEVCQKCAKQTKSTIVYPMCCTNQEDAYNWCHEYINYGKQSK